MGQRKEVDVFGCLLGEVGAGEDTLTLVYSCRERIRDLLQEEGDPIYVEAMEKWRNIWHPALAPP